jgi:hypothetical protein
VAEVGAAQKTKKSNTAALRNENNADVQARVSCRKVRVVTADEWDRVNLRREQLADDDDA